MTTSRRGESNTADVDWMTISIYLGLVLTGWLMIYAVGYRGEENSSLFDMGTRHGSQLVWIGVSITVGFVIMLIDGKMFRTFGYPIYIIACLFLLYVLVAGRVIAGSQSWFDLGFFRFQPSEVAKFATCLALATFLGPYNANLQTFRNRAIAIGIILLPMGLILLQGDAGSALVFSSLLIVLYREGMPPPLYILMFTMIILTVMALMFDSTFPIILGLTLVASGILVNALRTNRPKIIFFSFAVAALAVYNIYPEYELYVLGTTGLVFLILLIQKLRSKRRQLAILLTVGLVFGSGYTTVVNYAFYKVLKPHQQDRILVWLRPSKVDPLGALYNVTWSKRAIGSGGLTGKGFLDGNITKLNYVPEQVTDFIFCTVGEEQGFVGAFAIIMLFLLLLLRVLFIAERQRSKFTRIYAYGVASILFFHLLVNVGMTMGIMPVIGIPLPFISYGGSSLMAFTVLVAVLLRLDSDRLSVFR
ncbi:MAG: rod shape-determining protein RodA, partial [Saprospiraceae bacterium]